MLSRVCVLSVDNSGTHRVCAIFFLYKTKMRGSVRLRVNDKTIDKKKNEKPDQLPNGVKRLN